MKLVKKIIKKIYHLIWFLSVFFLFSRCVFAELANPNTNGTGILTPYSLTFADNTNNQLTRITSGWDDLNKRGWSNPITLSGGSSYGANIAFDTLQPFVTGYTYAVSILIGFPSSSSYAIPTGGKVCVAETLNNALTRFDSRYGFVCPSAVTHGTSGGVASWNVTDSNTGNQLYFGILTYVFTSNITATSVTMSFNSNTRLENTTIYFGGYMMEVLSDNQNLSQQEVQQAVQSSGLATASSVSQVQQSINQIQSDINSSANNIIDNQQQNTEDIINNQNENTDKEIDSQKVCKIIDKNSVIEQDKSLTSSNGSVANSNITLGVTDYFRISSTSQLTLLHKNTSQQSIACFYNVNKTFISCVSQRDLSEGLITIPNDASYFRATINYSSDLPTWELCSNGNQALDDSINSLNDSITNDDAPDIDLDLSEASDTPISDLLTMPLTILDSLINNLDGSCTNYTLPFLFNTSITFPCFTLSDYLGTTVTNYIDLFICLFMCYNIGMLCISIFDDITSLNDIFNSLYTPKHAYTGYKPKHGGD